MANKALHIGFNINDKNLFLAIYYQTRKYKIVALFQVISAPDFNTFFVYLLKYYLQYNIGI